MAQTMAQLVESIGDRIGDANHSRYEAPLLRRWINEASRELVRRTECLFGTATIAVVAGTQSYSLPTNVVRIMSVQYERSGQIFALEFIEQGAAQWMWGVNQSNQYSEPSMYSTWGHPGASSMTIRLFPNPGTAGTLRVYYARLPTELATDGSDDADPIDVPNGWEDPLLDYVQAQVYLRDRRTEEYTMMLQRFSERLLALNQTADRNYNTNPGMIVPLEMLDSADWWDSY